MAKLVAVTVMVDPEQETTIKPFAAQLSKIANEHNLDTTGSLTITYTGGKPDGDGTID